MQADSDLKSLWGLDCCGQPTQKAPLWRTLFALLLFFVHGDLLAADAPRAFQVQYFVDSRGLSKTVNLGYRLLEPERPKAAEELFPLVVYLHSAGSKGDDNEKQLQEEFPKLLANSDLRSKHPAYVLVPQCRDGKDAAGRPNNWVKWIGQKERPPAEWEQAEPEVSDQLQGAMLALEDVLARYPIDRSRIYLAGVSMGGSGAWNWAAREPERFAAVITACGLSEIAKVPALARQKIWAFHGSDDPIAPVARTRSMVQALRDAGSEVKFTEFEGVGHGIAERVFTENDHAVIQWLFAQKLQQPKRVSHNAQAVDSFEKHIRPLLAEHCIECHGEKKVKGGLRLDSRASAFAGGDLGPAIIAGDADKSLLIRAVRHVDEDLQMPPKRKLSEAAVAELVAWVKGGAVWPEDGGEKGVKAGGEVPFSDLLKSHWAFQPMSQFAVPSLKVGERAKTAIDGFILAKLEAAGLGLAPMADKNTLLRRVTLDLTGLPPSPEQVAAFLADESPEAFKKVVKRLLDSPHYGERWGRHWLDVARYADSNGSEVDHAMANAWRYRDYVVQAFNEDKPFDRFVCEQLAGDLFQEGSSAAMAATGFLMLGPKALADLDKTKLLADIIDEQVDTVSRAFMGLTIGCARCHDHKFDPIPTADYYALAGIFRSTRMMDMSKRVATWTERVLGAPGEAARVEALDKRLASLREEHQLAEKAASGAAQSSSKRPVLAGDAIFLIIEAEDFTRGNVGAETDSLGKGIGVIRTRMDYPDHVEYEFEVPVAGEYQIELRYAAKESRPTQLILNGNLEEMEAAAEVTGDWAPSGQRWFVQGKYTLKMGVNVLSFHRDGPIPILDQWIVGRVSAEPHWKRAEQLKAGGQRPTPNLTTRVKELAETIAKVEKECEGVPRVLAPFDGPVGDAAILIRGNPATPGPVVPRGFPAVFNPAVVSKPGAMASGRMELGQWLTLPKHPLTARVIVNRVWLWHFGEGLVRSPDNFGIRGEKPSHPELLDWRRCKVCSVIGFFANWLPLPGAAER